MKKYLRLNKLNELNQLRERISELEKDKLEQKNEMVYIDTTTPNARYWY